MPEFKAPAPEAKPLKCNQHGNDPSCPGPYACPGAILPSQVTTDLPGNRKPAPSK